MYFPNMSLFCARVLHYDSTASCCNTCCKVDDWQTPLQRQRARKYSQNLQKYIYFSLQNISLAWVCAWSVIDLTRFKEYFPISLRTYQRRLRCKSNLAGSCDLSKLDYAGHVSRVSISKPESEGNLLPLNRHGLEIASDRFLGIKFKHTLDGSHRRCWTSNLPAVLVWYWASH